MNLMDLQQVQTAKPITKLNGKDIPATGVGNFASLLQYFAQTATAGSENVSQEQNTTPVESMNEAEVEQFVLQLAKQPEQVLQLLDQPALEELKQDPKKAMELIQFIKTMQEGQGEQALDLLQQVSPPVQQAIVVAVSSIVSGIKENASPKEAIGNPVIRANVDPKAVLLFNTLPAVNPAVIAKTGEKSADSPILNRPVSAELMGNTVKTWIEGKKGLEPMKVVADPEGKEQPVALTGLKIDRMTLATSTLTRNLVPNSSVDEQLANRIEAALKQAPFLKGADGSTRMSIRLYPEQLGEVVVQLDRKEGMLTVKLFAATEQAKQLMDQQLGKLHTSLQAQAPLVKVETGLLASTVKEFEQGLPQERRERQQEESVPYEEEPEEDEDD
ncbi:flagellar hook-length control protein FliK [Exiguobacterium sp. RIT452]|uniref:flagellar hook-length control protein FliK n=1 Tax=Exiguobacterium sp. RIT452 TaxID=2315552 RepID=UPI000E73DF84|nr:flagellar hook-length control protein FliK [Exiguobacterium sp. RIT452]RJP00428.1 flagellar hook-length control protein FliK [Exiguobacterium sp. RIT452]